MAHKKTKTILGSVASLVVAAIVFSTVNYGFNTAVNDLPLGGQKGFDIPQFFGLSLTGTPAGAISCSVTNSVHLIATDGSDYDFSNSGGMFTPLYDLAISANGKTLDHVNVLVYLYCANPPSYYASSGYAPYLTGGSLSLQVQVHDVNGYLRNVGTYNNGVNAPNYAISGKSVQISSFTIPASAIYSVTGATSQFMTDVNLITSGSLTFVQSPSNSISATAQLNSVASYFGLTVKPSTTAITTTNNQAIDTTQSVILTSPSSSTNYQLDWSSSHVISYQVQVHDWSNSQPDPSLIILGYNTNQQYSSKIPITSTPSVSSSGGHAIYTWKGNIDLTNIDGSHSISQNGCYSLQLQPVSLAGGQQRYASTISFCIKDISTQSSSTSSSSQPLSGKSYFLYDAKYAGREDNVIAGQAPTASSISLNPADFIKQGFPYNGLGSINIQPIMDFSGLPQVLISNPKFTQKITITLLPTAATNDKNITLQNVEVQYASVNSNVGSNQVVISNIQVLPTDITNAIAAYNNGNNYPIALTNNQPIEINVALSGTFDANVGSNPYHGTLNTMTFKYDLTYVPLAINPNNYTPTNTTNSSSGGYCQGKTPQQCQQAGQQQQAANNALNDINNGGCNSSDPNSPCFINTPDQTVTNTSTSQTNTTPVGNNLCTNIFGQQLGCSNSNTNSSSLNTNIGSSPTVTQTGAVICPPNQTFIQCAQALSSALNTNSTFNIGQYSQYLPMIVVFMVIIIIGFVILKVAKSKK